MKIVIDLQGAQSSSRMRGIGRYSIALTRALAKNAGPHDIWLALNACLPHTIEEIRHTFKDVIPQQHIKIFYTNQKTSEYLKLNNPDNLMISKKLREHFLNSLSPDIIHISSLFEGWTDNTVTSIGELNPIFLTSATLYDIIPHIHSNAYLHNNRIAKFYYKKLQSLKYVDLLLAISASSRQEAINHLSISPDRIINCSSGVTENFIPIKISDSHYFELKKRYGINRKFILYVGGFDPRKNVDKLVEAFSLLPSAFRTSYQLVVVGESIESAAKNYLELLRTRHALNKDEIIVTNHIPDEQLINLYNLCQLFILPSLDEGFGFPLLEALACGAVAISSNITSLRSIMNCDDALFDPTKTNSIVKKMIEGLSNESFRNFLKEHGKKQAKLYRWDTCAKTVITAFENLHAKKKKYYFSNVYKPLKTVYTKKKMVFISSFSKDTINHNLQLLCELACFYEITLIVNKEIIKNPLILANFTIKDSHWFIQHGSSFDIILYQFDNSPLCYNMLDLFITYPGILILNDFFLSTLFHWIDTQITKEKNIFYRILYESHGYISLFYHEKYGRIPTLKKYPCNFSLLKKATGIIVRSQHDLNLADTWYQLNNPYYIKKIPHLYKLNPLIDKDTAKKKLKLTKNDFLICSFSFTTPNTLSLRLCLGLLNSDLFNKQNFIFVFIGKNKNKQLKKELSHLIKKYRLKHKIIIDNIASNEIIDTYLAAADLAIQLQEQPKPTSITKCLAVGIPTITANQDSLQDLPEATVFRLNEDFTDQELIDTIEKLYTNQDLRHQLSQQALNYVKTLHPTHIGNNYKETIDFFYTKNPLFLENHLINNLAEQGSFNLDSDNITLTVKNIAANRIDITLPQLLVDITYLAEFDAKTGIQRVVRGILLSILQNPLPNFRIEPIYLNGDGHFCYARSYMLNKLGLTAHILEDSILEVSSGDFFLGLDLSPHGIPKAKTILQDWRLRGIKLYFVLYDLLPILKPKAFPLETQINFPVWLKTVSEIADGVICISKTVSEQYFDWMQRISIPRIFPLNIGFFHLGSNIEVTNFSIKKVKENRSLLRLISTQLSFLCVGTIEPRKGYLQLLNAFNLLWEKGFDLYLIIVGCQGWMVERLIEKICQHPEQGKRLFWLKKTSDELLKEIYLNSSALILTSENEGFGLPLIEAAQFGTSIIARDIPVFREVAGEHVFYFKGSEPWVLANAIEDWLSLYNKKMQPNSKYIKCLNWQESAQQLLDVFLCDNWFKKLEVKPCNLNLAKA